VKKILLPIFTILLIVSCNISDDNAPCGIPDGALVDPITQTIYIELVNSNGENLITNETIVGQILPQKKTVS
jgi:hypothetical protein